MTINKLIKIVKHIFIFACIILWSCEKETVEDPNKVVAKSANTKYLNAEELPAEFQDYFIPKNSNSSAKSNGKENDLNNAIFTEYDIVSMTDYKNITNYSISFFYPDTPENIFYNLVINVLPTGENSRYIFKYICNPADFQNFKAHNFDFKYFVGMTEISLAPTSSNGTLTSKMNTGDEDCPKIYIPSSSDSGGNSGAAGGGGGDSSSSGGFNTSVPGYNAPGHTVGGSLGPSTGGSGGHDHSGCYGSNGQYWYSAGDVRPPHSHNEKKATDCPDLVPPPGNVPVIPMPMIKVLGKELALSSNQIIFLRDKPDLMNVINQHLEENNFSEESKNFARTKINAAIIEKKIDDTKLDACTKAVLDKLKNLKQADIAGILAKLGGNSETYILTLEIGEVDGNHPAGTFQTSYNCYKTVFDNDFLYGIDGTGINKPPTDLAIAAVMIHEIVHANFFSLFDDKVNSGIPTALDNFDLLYKKYVTRNYNDTDDAQHAQIWKSFIDIMSSALQEYHTGNPTDKPSQFYQDIILGTLKQTNTFKSKYPEGGDENRRITNNFLTEKNNGSNDPNYTPKGTPCK